MGGSFADAVNKLGEQIRQIAPAFSAIGRAAEAAKWKDLTMATSKFDDHRIEITKEDVERFDARITADNYKYAGADLGFDPDMTAVGGSFTIKPRMMGRSSLMQSLALYGWDLNREAKDKGHGIPKVQAKFNYVGKVSPEISYQYRGVEGTLQYNIQEDAYYIKAPDRQRRKRLFTRELLEMGFKLRGDLMPIAAIIQDYIDHCLDNPIDPAKRKKKRTALEELTKTLVDQELAKRAEQ